MSEEIKKPESKNCIIPNLKLDDDILCELLEYSKCTSASCNNESQNFCDCGSVYEDFVIKGLIVESQPDLIGKLKEAEEIIRDIKSQNEAWTFGMTASLQDKINIFLTTLADKQDLK